jgi:hypothetical protein
MAAMAVTSSSRGVVLLQSLLRVAAGAREHFRPWTYDVPLAIRPGTHDRLRRVQQLYLKCIRRFVEHFDRYRDLMPVPDRVSEILALAERRPYRPGAYRTDVIIGEDNRFRVIETTCRFALNGFFRCGVLSQLADEYLAAHPGIRRTDVYMPFFHRLMDYFGPFDRVCVLLGWNTAKNESKFFTPVFEAAGCPVTGIPFADVPSATHRFENAAVIGELSHEELCSLPTETVQAIIESNLLNDLRTVFLIHDKRFFALLNHEGFMNDALTPAERDEFRPHLIPTYTRHLNPEVWPEARRNKDRWIIKPPNQGMSMDVYAGPLTGAAEWESLFASGRADSMVLQEYVAQRKFRGAIAGTPHEDYAASTLLCFEDGYYGTGVFRASSFPVTNQGDDRKIAPLVTPDFQCFEKDNVL